MLRVLICLLVPLVQVLCSEEKVYRGYKVYDIHLRDEQQLELMKEFEEAHAERDELDFLSFHNNVNDVVKLMVKPSQQKSVEKFLISKDIEYEVVTSNVQDVIDGEYEQQKLLSKKKSQGISFDRYYRYEEINKYLDSVAAENPTTVTVKSVGKSYEGRDIKIMTITNGDGQKKNSIFIDAGIHAREWIAPAASLYLINQLVDSQSNFSKLLDKVDFVIHPLVNPDGYEFTHNFYRMWRKTRSRHSIGCSGVDANRNYDFHWSSVGSSSNRCAETYHGPQAFSENESKISRDVIDEIKENCKFFLTFHSYGNYLIYPNGYTNDLPENWRDMDDVAQAGAEAIRRATGTNYTVGSTSNVLYLASGSSTDYAHGAAGIPIAICMELTGGGILGFDLPPSEIEKTVKETLVGVEAMVEVVASKY